MSEFELPWLLGDAFRNATVNEVGEWQFVFASGGGIAPACPWRLLLDGGIVVSSEDHSHQYGLPAPIDAAVELSRHLQGTVVTSVVIMEGTADLHIRFGPDFELQVLPFSSGYEAWQASSPTGYQIIAQGGGQLSGYQA